MSSVKSRQGLHSWDVPFCGRTICTWAHNSFHGIIGQRWLLLRFQIKISGGYICYKGISSNIWINSAGAVSNCTGGESSNCESPQKVWIGGESLLCSGEGWGSLSTHMYYISLIMFVSAITIKNVLAVGFGFFWVGSVEVWLEWFEERRLFCTFWLR